MATVQVKNGQLVLGELAQCKHCKDLTNNHNTKVCFNCLTVDNRINAMALRNQEGCIDYLERKIAALQADLEERGNGKPRKEMQNEKSLL